jgi:hypothetical protein
MTTTKVLTRQQGHRLFTQTRTNATAGGCCTIQMHDPHELQTCVASSTVKPPNHTALETILLHHKVRAQVQHPSASSHDAAVCLRARARICCRQYHDTRSQTCHLILLQHQSRAERDWINNVDQHRHHAFIMPHACGVGICTLQRCNSNGLLCNCAVHPCLPPVTSQPPHHQSVHSTTAMTVPARICRCNMVLRRFGILSIFVRP